MEVRSTLAAGLVAAAVITAAPAQALELKRVEPRAAVSGAAIELRGSGLKGRGTKVVVGGKRARIMSARARTLRVVIPKLRPGARKVVVRRGRASASARLQVLRPFTGSVGVKVDRGRAQSGTIGHAGGEVEARGREGTRYTLQVPAGALTKDEAITVTPVTEFRGLPLTGGLARGAELKPDGLRFAQAATLTIVSDRSFPRNTVGFSDSGGGDGDGFEVQDPGGSGRTITLRIDHFSSAGASSASAADFANAVSDLLDETGALSEGQVRSMIELIKTWAELFPPAFCATQPVCGRAVAKGLDSLAVRIDERCQSGRESPTLQAVRDLVRLDSLRQELGSGDVLGRDCREEILTAILDSAKSAVQSAPLGSRAAVADIAPADGGGGDLDGDGDLTNLEFLFFLVGPLQNEGHPRAPEAQTAASNALQALPVVRPSPCNSDRTAGERDLQRALDYAQALSEALTPYVEAMDACRAEVAIAPLNVTLGPGEEFTFAAGVLNLLDEPRNGDVSFSAIGGAITQGGTYTAPNAPGTYQVRATSVLNTARSATATVTVVTDDGPFVYRGSRRFCQIDPTPDPGEDPLDCDPFGAVTVLIVREGGAFTFYLNGGGNLPDTNTCGVGSNCFKTTGSSSATSFAGPAQNSGSSEFWTLEASVSGGLLTGRIDATPAAGFAGATWFEFEATPSS